MRIVSIDFNFLKKSEVDVELLYKGFYLGRSSTFLSKKLIAWKCQDIKPFWLQLLMHCDHRLVI